MSNATSTSTSDRRLLHIEARPSDSPMVETVWRSRSHQAGTFLSIASSHWELIVSRHEGRIYCTVHGPETHPTMAHCPPDGDWLGIHFRHSVFMPHLPVGELARPDSVYTAKAGSAHRNVLLMGFSSFTARIPTIWGEKLWKCKQLTQRARATPNCGAAHARKGRGCNPNKLVTSPWLHLLGYISRRNSSTSRWARSLV